MFEFLFAQGQRLRGEEIDLVVDQQVPADSLIGWLPAYQLLITLSGHRQRIGRVNVRLGYTEDLEFYAGHLGYEVVPEHRGNRYAVKACLLTRQIFEAHDMSVCWITCDPDNMASRRTCEILGCDYVDTVELPSGNDMYERGDRLRRRYRWDLSQLTDSGSN